MSVTFKPILDGYLIESRFNGITNSVKIEHPEGGKITASTITFGLNQSEGDFEWSSWDEKKPAHWVYSMLSGNPSESLLEILGVPHAERASVALDIFNRCKSFSDQNLPLVNHKALSAMSAAADKKLATYNFLSIDGDKGLYRQQAAQVYPVLADILNSNISIKMAIDRQKPLNDVLITLLSDIAEAPLGKGFLKRLSKAPALPEKCHLSSVVRFAAQVQTDWLPSSNEDWQAFYCVATALVEDMEVSNDQIPGLIKGSKGNWSELIDRCLVKAYPDPKDPAHSTPFDSFRSACAGVRDTLISFSDMAVIPIVCHAQASDTVYLNASIVSSCEKWGWDILFTNRNLTETVELSRYFHQKYAEIVENTRIWEVDNSKEQIAEDGWPGLTDPVQAPNGLWIIPLCSPKELKQEGSELTHCVGGYTRTAEACDSHIVSVRKRLDDGSYKSLSTCEFDGIKKEVPDNLSQKQHRASFNQHPSVEALDAISWYTQCIKTGTLAVNWSLIRAFLDDELVTMDQVEKLCGYDWRERESLDRALSQWGPYVAKAYRKMGTDDLLDSKEASDIIDKMTPDFLSSYSS